MNVNQGEYLYVLRVVVVSVAAAAVVIVLGSLILTALSQNTMH